jgi:hypothetical protein
MSRTDTSDKGLESLIVSEQTGRPIADTSRATSTARDEAEAVGAQLVTLAQLDAHPRSRAPHPA